MTGSPETTPTGPSSDGRKFVALDGRWQTHLYDSTGKWVGFFDTAEAATEYADKKKLEGYDVTTVRPVKGYKPGMAPKTAKPKKFESKEMR